MLKLTYKMVAVFCFNRGNKFAEMLKMSIPIGIYQMSN